MLINTVVLFLKDLLPIFILLCLLKSNMANITIAKVAMLKIFIASAAGVIVNFKFLPLIGELWGGAGLEIIKTVELLFIYICFVFSSSYVIENKPPSHKQLYVMALALTVFIMLNASTFIVFLDSYIINTESANIVIAGLVIGLGISLSFSALLVFLLLWLQKQEYHSIIYTFWAFFLTGQLSQIVSLLQQVDIIQSSEALWDSSSIVEDKSEYGHLLNTLFGYEASPSLEFIILYGVSLFTLFIYFYKFSRSQYSRNKHTFDHSNNTPVGKV